MAFVPKQHWTTRVGVDVMKIRVPWTGGLDGFIETLSDQVRPYPPPPLTSVIIEITSGWQLHEQEKFLLASLPQSQKLRYIMLLWTHKEATSKALGTGLGAVFSQLRVDFDPERFDERSLPRRASVTLESDDDDRRTCWDVESMSLGEMAEDEHIVAVAFNAGPEISRSWMEVISLERLLQHAQPLPR
jgi:hypothetical protein